MQMHAADGGRVAVKGVLTLARLGVPHFQGAVCASTHNDIALHLRRPYSSSMTDQRSQAL